MKITMVKKRMANGEACRKCRQTEELLVKRGLWERIDEVVWAIEGDSSSPGFVLGQRLGVEHAPFFVVEEKGESVVYRSALKMIKERLVVNPPPPAPDQAPEQAFDLEAIQLQFEGKTPAAIVAWALTQFGHDLAIAFSGAEDVVLIDLAVKSGLDFSVFSLDTGRLHPETYEFIERLRSHYGIAISLVSPDPTELEPFVREKGLFSFYEDGHQECCGIRKVAPLRRALATRRAWMTGQRKDQSPATRSNTPCIEMDGAFVGQNDAPLLKVNPLMNWTSKEVWGYIRTHDVPYNSLHEQGFISIGCAPCTRAPRPGEHERAGRWWWEESTKKECGLHLKE